MLFQDSSCTANDTIQKIHDYGIYRLIGADWVAITTISFRGNVFIDASKDINGVDQAVPLAFLEEHKHDLSDGIKFENTYYCGVYILVIRFRSAERYACYNVYCKTDSPFNQKDIAWLKNYSRANLEITRLRNENVQNREYIDTVFNSINSSILALRADGSIILSNRCAKKSFSLCEKEFDINFLKLLDDDAPQLLAEAIDNAMQQKDSTAPNEITIYNKASNRIFNMVLSPLKDSKENVSGVVLIANDITNQKMIELELEQLKQFGLLGDIAVGLAHDIKNPLMNILGCARIAAKGHCQPQTKDDMMQMIQLSAGRINTVLEQMLSYGRLNQQHDTMVDVNAVIRSCITMVERHKFDRMLEIEADLDDSLPQIRASEIHIQQVFLNVLLNAVQAIEHSGAIKVFSAYGDISRAIQVVVDDNGSGIPEQMKEKIFSPYVTTRANGTGLGLFIVRRTLAQYNGTIEIASEEGKGTECRITIPIPPQ